MLEPDLSNLDQADQFLGFDQLLVFPLEVFFHGKNTFVSTVFQASLPMFS